MPKTIHVPNQAVGVVSIILERRAAEYQETLDTIPDCKPCKDWGDDLCAMHGDIAYLQRMVNEVIIQLNS